MGEKVEGRELRGEGENQPMWNIHENPMWKSIAL